MTLRGRRLDSGFTLVELLVVVVIIGIIAGIAIPVFMNQKAKARDAAVAAQLNAIAKTVESALSDEGSGLIAGSSVTGSLTAGAATGQVNTTQGVSWRIVGTPNNYCAASWAAGSRYTSADPLVWDSHSGGLQPAGGGCSPFAAAAFTAPATGTWGVADQGGEWTNLGTASDFSVSGGVGIHRISGAGWHSTSFIPMAYPSADVTVQVTTDVAATGSGLDLDVWGRASTTASSAGMLNDGYMVRIKLGATGNVRAQLVERVAGGETVMGNQTIVIVPAGGYTPGQVIRVRLQVFETDPTTVRAKVWMDGSPEPTTWALMQTSTTSSLQSIGNVALHGYTRTDATVPPAQVIRWSNFKARPLP